MYLDHRLHSKLLNVRLGATMGSENAKNGRAKLANAFL
jgi:hypothetical protein